MANPISRDTLIEYCLRRLGAPVIEINVDEEQVSDRIDDALQFYQEYHSDAVQKVYLKHLLTPTDIVNQYIPVTDATISVSRVLPISSSLSSSSMFSAKYQMYLNDLYNLNYMGSLTNYVQTMQYMSLIDTIISGSGTEIVQFNRHTNKLHLRMDWSNVISGQYIIVEGYQIIDPETYTDVYNDMFLKQYATALIKNQWGANLIKFEGMVLPGGVTLNGRQMFDDSNVEIAQIREAMQLAYEMPPMMMVG
tara:strand:+ start:308 stop:1057 length:750 start_codon:yes stop_codon:yes gene_type:complete